MKINIHKKRYIILTFVLMIAMFFVATPVYAASLIAWLTTSVLLPVIGFVAWIIISIVGKITVLLSSLVVSVASYNDFVNSPAVATGWYIVRDLCNMFFILIMMIVAFATVLRYQKYNAASLLKYVLIYAILINFSKSIAGLFIDMAQAVMGTFVSAFSGLGGADFLHVLGIDSILNMNYTHHYADFWIIVSNFVIMVIYAIVAMVVIGTTLLVFAMRIVMLWLYIILSPLAYLTAILPATRSISNQWWNKFTKEVVTGPALAFFIWLTFSTLNTITSPSQMGFSTAQGLNAGAARMASTGTMLQFIIAISMLVSGLAVAKGIGGVSGSIAGSGMQRLQRGAGWAKRQTGRPFRWAGRKAKKVASSAAKSTGRGLKRGAIGLAKGTDAALFKGKIGKGLHNFKEDILKAGILKKAFHKATKQKFSKDYDKARRSARRNGGKYKDAQGKEYKLQEDGTYQDSDGHHARVNGEILKDYKNEKAARFSEAWAASKLAREHEIEMEKEEDELFSAHEKLYKDMSSGELKSALNVESDPKKQAAIAMQIAKQGAFDNKTEEDKAYYEKVKNIVRKAGGDKMLKSFVDKVNKKQASLNYDLSRKEDGTYKSQASAKAFKDKVAKGDIRLDEQKLSSLNKDILLAFKDALPTNQFNNQLKKAYEKDQHVGNQLNKIIKEAEQTKEGSEKVDFLRNLGAKFTGDLKKFFGKYDKKGNLEKDNDGNVVFHEDKLKDFLRKANAESFSNLKVEDLEENMHLKNAVIDSVSFGKLKSIEKKGDNIPLVKYLVKEMTKEDVSHVDSKEIASAPELSSFVDETYNPDIVKKNKLINEALKKEKPALANNHAEINRLRQKIEKEEQPDIEKDKERIARIRQRLEKGNEEIDYQNLKIKEENKLIDKENEASFLINVELDKKLKNGKITEEERNLFYRKPLKHIQKEDKIDIENSKLLKSQFSSVFDKKKVTDKLKEEIKKIIESEKSKESNQSENFEDAEESEEPSEEPKE